MEGWRAAAALLLLAATIEIIRSAPLNEQTALDVYDGESSDGCYYNFQHYGEGDRIMTNEPCLNCTCHNRMLMCYLRVCPFTKPIGQDCSVEKRGDQCCPVITCPDVPVDLLTSTSTALPSDSTFTDVGHLDKFGCSIDGRFYAEGSKVPAAPNKPCELCYCIRNMTACVMQECTLHVDGCTPVYRRDVCCPVRYSCDHPDEDLLQLDDLTTTVRPTPGFMLTTTVPPGVTQDCVHDDNVYADGALIKTEKACEHCYCMKGDIVCVVQECGAPMENEGKNCTALAPREGQCCPDTYICEGDDETSTESTESTEISSTPDVQSAIKDDVSQEKVSIFDKYPDAQSEIPKIPDDLSQEDITQSHIPEGQEVQDKLETEHLITTEATKASVAEISTTSQYSETENTVLPVLFTDAEKEEIVTELTSDTAETSQTSNLPNVDIDSQKTEEIPETEYTSTPEHISIATKTTKRYFDQFTGITTKSLPEFLTKSDIGLIGDNVYTTHTNPSYGEELVTVTDNNITPSGDSISTSSEQTLFTQDKIQTENAYESSSETDISTRLFTSKSPSRTTPIAQEPLEPITSDQILLPESTQAPSVTDQAIFEDKIPSSSPFTPEISTSEKSTDVAAPVTDQNAANDVTIVEFEDNNKFEITTAPSFETTIVTIPNTEKLEDHTANENYVPESTTEYVTDKLTNGDNNNQITISNINNNELPTTMNIDLVSTTLSSTDVVDESEKEGDDRVPILPQIPGEGDCLVDGITYINDSIIPNANKCVITCRCVSSIVHCDQVACNPPPAEMINCEPIDDGKDSCCPTYVCDQSKQTIKPESDSQMSGLTSASTPHTIEDITTAQISTEKTSVQEVEIRLPDSESTTSLADVSCDSGECQTKEELKPTLRPTEESGTVKPESVEDVLCDTAECKFTKEPQKPIQDEENRNAENSIVSGCSGNDCHAPTGLGSGDFTTISVLSDVTTQPTNTIGEEHIDSPYGTKPCDSADCEVQNEIVTSVESSPNKSSGTTEFDKTTTVVTNDCESGNCERTTTLQPSVTEATDETLPFTIIDKEISQESSIDKCVGDDCQVTAIKPAVKPIACSSEDCQTESDDFTPPESATIKPTEETLPFTITDKDESQESIIDKCVGDDCQVTATELAVKPIACSSEDCQTESDDFTPPESATIKPTEETLPFTITDKDKSQESIIDKCVGDDCQVTATEPAVKPIACSSEDCQTESDDFTPPESATIKPTEGTLPFAIIDKQGSQESIIDKCVGDDCQVTATEPGVKPIACSSEDCQTESDDFTASEFATNKPTDGTLPFTMIDKEGSQESIVDKCVGDDCQVTATKPAVKPIACSSEDCQTESDDFTPLESATIRPTGEKVEPCDSEDCQSGTDVESTATFADCTSSECQSGIDENTEQPSVNESVCTSGNCKYPETSPVSPTPAELFSTPNISHSDVDVDETPIAVDVCTTADCISQDVTENSIAELPTTDIECTGENCISENVAGSTSAPADVECHGHNCVKVPMDEGADTTGSPVTPSDTKHTTDGFVSNPDSGTQDVTDNSFTTPGYGIQDDESSTVTYPDVTQKVVANTVKPPEIAGQDAISSLGIPSDTQDVEGSPVTYPDHGIQEVTDSSVTSSNLATGIVKDSPVTLPEQVTQLGTEISVPSLDSSDQDTTNKPLTTPDSDTVDATINPITAVSIAEVECKDDSCVKVEKPQCLSSECLSQAVTAIPIQDCNGDECVNVPTPICITPECESQAVPASIKPQNIPTDLGCDGNDCELQHVTDGPVLEKKPSGAECDRDDCMKVPTIECSSPDCSLQAVTVSPIQKETATEVVCSGDDCAKAPQPEVILESLETHKPDTPGCDGDDCVKEQKPECSSSECDSQDVAAGPILEVNPEKTDCDHCIETEIPKCSSPDCVSSDSAAVTESQFAPSVCQGAECVNLQIAACNSSDCAIVDVPKTAVPEVKPTVECDSGDCEIQQTTVSYPKLNEDELLKITTKADTIEVATETSNTITPIPNLVPNQGISTPEQENTPALPESSTTAVDHGVEQSTQHNDFYSTIVHDDIPQVNYETERPSINKEGTEDTSPKLPDVITTVQYVTDYTPEDKVHTTTTSEDIEVMTPSVVLIEAAQETNKLDSDLHTTLLPEESYGSETQTQTSPSEQELGEIKPNSQEKDQLSIDETTNPALSEQSVEVSTEVENEVIISTTETIIKSPEQHEDSSESTDSKISSTVKPLIVFEESEPQTTSIQINQGELETTQTTDLDESQVSPITTISIESVTKSDGDVHTTKSPIAEVTTSATFDNSNKISDKPPSTEGIDDELPINIVQDTSDKEITDNVLTVTDKLYPTTAEQSAETSTKRPDEDATNKTETETSTELDKRTEEITHSDIGENQLNTYSPTEPEVFLKPEATTPKLSDTDNDKLNNILPGTEQLTSTTLRPLQSTEIVNIETTVPDTTESFEAISTPEQEPDTSHISTVMSQSVTPVPGLESDSLVTHVEEPRPNIELTTTVPDLQAVTSNPTPSQTDDVSINKPLSGENEPVVGTIAPSKVESPKVDEDTPKTTDYHIPSSPSIDYQTVATEPIPPYKQEDVESDIKQTPSSVESSTYYSEESVPVTSMPVEIPHSTEESHSSTTEQSSVLQSEITPNVDDSTTVSAYDSQSEISSNTSPSDNADETEIHSVPKESTILPTSKKSEVTPAPENIENKYTTSFSIVANEEQTTSHEILSSEQPISDTSKYEATTGLPIIPVSKDDHYQETSTPSENYVPTLHYEIPTDSQRPTTPTTDGKISAVEINATPTPVSNIHEIITELTQTTFETNFGGEVGTTTISAVEDNIQQDNRIKPIDSKDVTTPNPIESENPTEENLPTHGHSNDIFLDSETSSSTPSRTSVPENIGTTLTPTKEEENILLSETPSSIQTTDSDQVIESGTSPSIIEPEVILEGSGQEPESDIYKPSYTEPTTMAAVSDSNATVEMVPVKVSVDDSEPKPESEASTQINRDSNKFTTLSLGVPTTEQVAVDISDLSVTSERGETGVSDSGFTKEEEKETATDFITSAVTSGPGINVESDVTTPANDIQKAITTIAGISVETSSVLGSFHDPTETADDITQPLITDTSTPNYLDIAKTEVTVQPISTSATVDSVTLATKQTEHPEVFVTETTTLSKIETPDNAGNRFGGDGSNTTSSSLAIPETSEAEQTTTHTELSTVYNAEASPDDISLTTIGSLDKEQPETITKLDTDQPTEHPHSMVTKETEYFSTMPPESEGFVSLTTLLGIPTGSGLLENVTPSQITTASETVHSTGSITEEPSAPSEPDVEKTSIAIEKTTIYPHSEVNEADLGLQPETPTIGDVSKPDAFTPTEGAQSTYPEEDEVQENQKPIAPDTQSNLPVSGSVGIPLPGEDSDHQLPESSFPYGQAPEEYDHEEDEQSFGPGTCRYGGKVYVSAQQIPRDDPCDFCFCFRSDIICLQQSCPPPIHGCHEEPIQGFCCPRYECPVSMATTLNVTSTTTTTTTTLPPHFLPHAYKGAAQRRGCQIKGHSYQVGENVRASSGPCLNCTCGGDGQMKCDPKVCTPEPMLRQMIAAAVSTKRRR